MMTRLHLAILWAGARIVHAHERAEWLAEWQTELWYAIHEGRGRRVTLFCLGALRDAVWKRKNAGIFRCYGSVLRIGGRPDFPEPPVIDCPHPLESPFRCLAFLGLLALAAISAGLLTPAPSLSQGKPFLKLLVCCVVVWPVVVPWCSQIGSPPHG